MSENNVVNCEYLVDNQLCKSIIENEEGLGVREKGCIEAVKNLCCYRCFHRESCEISCNYLDKSGASQSTGQKTLNTDQEHGRLWQNSIFLEKGEQIVASWRGNREMTAKVVERGSLGRKRIEEAKERKNGFLVLTSQRLLFLKEHGTFGKSYHQVLAIPLLKVGGISIGGMISPFVCIADDLETHTFHIQGIGKNEFEPFRQLVMDQCRKRREEIEAERKRDRVQVVLDFSALKDYMEKGGLVLQKTKCPECGAPMPLPTTGNQTKCDHCGSIVYAQDIFEKVKALIG